MIRAKIKAACIGQVFIVIKEIIIKALSSTPLDSVGSWLYRHHVPVFMLHRFTCEEIGVKGHDPAFLRYSLEFLRKNGFNFVSVDEIVHAVKTETSLPPKSVAFTLDDGYSEQVDISAEVFAAFDCPATYYVSTGFIRKELWYWDDKIHFLVENCDINQLEKLKVSFPGTFFTGSSFTDIASSIVLDCTTKSLVEIEKKISEVAQRLAISIPVQAPAKYSPASWNSLRAVERRGMMVGAHSYSHPVLSRENYETAELEITKSTIDIKDNLSNPSKVFCYPIGREQDFSKREVDLVKKLGYEAAISSCPSAVNLRLSEQLYALPRFSFPTTYEDFVQYASWIESFKNQMRGSLGRYYR